MDKIQLLSNLFNEISIIISNDKDLKRLCTNLSVLGVNNQCDKLSLSKQYKLEYVKSKLTLVDHDPRDNKSNIMFSTCVLKLLDNIIKM